MTQPTPDPGNAPPDQWTEDMTEDEIREVAERLQREHGDS